MSVACGLSVVFLGLARCSKVSWVEVSLRAWSYCCLACLSLVWLVYFGLACCRERGNPSVLMAAGLLAKKAIPGFGLGGSGQHVGQHDRDGRGLQGVQGMLG